MAILSMRFSMQRPFRMLLWAFLLVGCIDNNAYTQCSLVCKPVLQVSLNQNGETSITPQMIAPSAATSCPGALTLELTNNTGNLLPNPLTCQQIGQSVTATITHNQTGNSCNSTITVIDALPPVATCSDRWIWCNQDVDPIFVGIPDCTDNCTQSANLQLAWNDTETNFNCGVLQNGIAVKKRIDRTWTVTDAAGNSAHCTQKVWLKQITLSAITFPANRDGVILPALDCGQDPEDLTLTGEPSIEGVPIGQFGGCDIGITYADQRIDICPPAGFALLRTWTAVDFCLGAISNRIQIIKIQDNTPPGITPPSNITVGTAGFTCTGIVSLPLATTTDNCSSVTVAPSWSFGTGYGPFNNVPLGTYTVTYTATDACANSRTATMKVTVADQTPPQAICKSSLQISLSSSGSAFATPTILDGGSSDNCGPVNMLVSRDGINFASSQELTCTDQINPVILTLMVTDAGGLNNLCETELTVRDFLKPNLQCPPNITLHCQQDYTDLNLTGMATASDNCGLDTLFFTNQLSLGACNIGSLARVWRAIDQASNVRTCTQQITITALSTVTVQFPANKIVQSCAGPQDLLPALTGAPAIGGQYCSPLSITYNDNVIAGPAPYCKRILRAWKVIDGCIYTGNINDPGIWEHIQTIDVIDQQAPLLSLPQPLVVTTGSGGCQAFIDLPDVIGTDCSAQVTVLHNSPYALNPGSNASGLYPLGIHNIVFTATDDCGNTAQKTLNIEVRDATKPNALCKSTLTLPLLTGGTATLMPNDLDNGSNDACTPTFNLIKAVVPSEFTCSQLGVRQVTLFIGDLSGNVATCTTTVKITDPNHYCNTGIGDTYMIGGGIVTELGGFVRSIPVQLTTTGLSIWSDCDTTGHFLVEDLAADSSYRVRPFNNGNWFNGVSTFDLVLISKHILGILPLNSPYKMIAADVNKSGSVTTFDIVQLRKLILGIYDTVPGVTSWRFVPANFNFSNPSNPFSAGFPEELLVSNLQADQLNNDFIGIKVGDMNNNTDPADARTPIDTAWIRVPEITWPAGTARALTLTMPDKGIVEGFQFELQLDTTLVKIDSMEFLQPNVLGPEHVALNAKGQLRISWNASGQNFDPERLQKAVLRLQVTAKHPVNTKDFLKMGSERLAPEWYGMDGTLRLALQIKPEMHETGTDFRLIEVYPNPFTDQTALIFELSATQPLSLRLYDVTGKLQYMQTQTFSAGHHTWYLRGSELPGAGLYWYRLEGESGRVGYGKLMYQP